MNERLHTWMTENSYTNSTLAKELGWSYDYIYKIVNERPIPETFKWRFADRFGMDVAKRVFDPSPDTATA